MKLVKLRDDEPTELHLNSETLSWFEPGMFEPTAGELEPGDEGRLGVSARRMRAPASGLLNRDGALGVLGTCVMIGVSHDRLLVRVDGGQRVVWVGAHAARASFTALEVVRISLSGPDLGTVFDGRARWLRKPLAEWPR